MDMLRDLVPPLRSVPQNSYSSNQLSSYDEFFTSGNVSSAGYAVTEKTAMSVSAVYACVGLIAGAIASLPLQIYQRTDGGRERVDELKDTKASALWWFLNEQPHSAWSAAVFWEYIIASYLLCGDGMAWIQRRFNGDIVSIEPLHPSCVRVDEDERTGNLLYTYFEDGKTVVIPQDDVLHIPGLGYDGYRGMSAIKYAAKNAIGTAIASEEYSAAFFKNGARPDFLITTPGKMDKEQQEIFRENWANRYGGASRAHMPGILTGGGDVKQLTMTAEDSQLIETRKFQVVDIARIFGVPPFMIGETEKQSSWGSGIESMGIGFVKYTLQRHLTKIEQEINRKIFPKSLRWFSEFNTAGLERGDLKSRYEAHRIALGRAGEPGWKTVNEIRKIENDPPIDGGDELNKGNQPQPAATPA